MSFFDKFHKNKFDKFHKNKKEGGSMETWKLTASGVVQGVGFRWSVASLAQNLGIPGTVRNNAGGSVTITLQGNKGQINEFIKDLPHKISPYARIANITTEKLSNVEKMHGFHVLY